MLRELDPLLCLRPHPGPAHQSSLVKITSLVAPMSVYVAYQEPQCGMQTDGGGVRLLHLESERRA